VSNPRTAPPLASEILRQANERYFATKTFPPPVGAPPLADSILTQLRALRPDRPKIAAPPLAETVLAGFSIRRRAGSVSQRSQGPAVQRKAPHLHKIYPNLHPGANTHVDPETVFHLREVAGGYRAQQGHSSRWFIPNLKYNFVTTLDGDVVMHNRYRHPPLAEGRAVRYAGEAEFQSGKLSWWSNASGHYRPSDDDAVQAGLPMDGFYPYDQVLKGLHKRKVPPVPAAKSQPQE
jgi:hypothetical protein